MKKQILVILSSALCDAELQFLFGPIPAAAVPVGGKTLLQLQIEAARDQVDEIIVTWPDTATPQIEGVTFIANLRDLELHEVLNFLIRQLVCRIDDSTCVHFLWGDTLRTSFLRRELPIVYTTNDYVGSTRHWDFLPGTERAFVGHFTACRSTVKKLHDSPLKDRAEFIKFLGALHVERVAPDSWKDFGHLSTYFTSKHAYLKHTTRNFNALESVDHRTVTKRGPKHKIFGELNWFANLPPALQIYAPKLLTNPGRFDGEYSLEYSPLPTLSEMYVHGKLRDQEWECILERCFKWLDASMDVGPAPLSAIEQSTALFQDKPLARFAEYPDGMATTRIRQNIDHCREIVGNATRRYSYLVHGDLCFSNILYDHRLRDIVLIDPRGVDNDNTPTLFGDIRYDLAKLFHSLVGYDHIMADRPFERNQALVDFFLRSIRLRFDVCREWLLAQTALLFYSMVPLHSDRPDHQHQFIRLANELVGEI